MRWIYLDGEYVSEKAAKVSVFDHGLLYGDGIFEGIRAYDGRVFKLKEHINRLYDSALSIYLNIGISREEMQDVVLETCRRNNLSDAYIRLVVTRGPGDLGLDPFKCPRAVIICIAAAIQLYPPELYREGLKIITATTRRNINEGLNPRIKSLNYLNNILAKIEGRRAGAMEALMLNHDGYVTEATADNVFIVKNGVLMTPPKWVGILEGITRNTIIHLASGSGLPVKEEPLTRHDVYTADECFLTGTASELVPVGEVDGRIIGTGKPGPVTRQLMDRFCEHTRKEGVYI